MTPGHSVTRLIASSDVGAPSNDISCNTAETLEQALDPLLVQFIQSIWGDGNALPTPQELCAHTFYGSAPRRNLGTVCKIQPNGKSVPVMDWSRTSPVFLPEFYTWRIFSFVSLPFVQNFCLAACQCAGEDGDDINSRIQNFNGLLAGIAVPQSGQIQIAGSNPAGGVANPANPATPGIQVVGTGGISGTGGAPGSGNANSGNNAARGAGADLAQGL